MKTRAIAIIPARGGSKRIYKKNIKNFWGQPILAYSIIAAIKSKVFERILVSTDDLEIAETAKVYGAEVPFLRPQKLSDDFCNLDAVVDHAISWCKQNENLTYHYCCMIYATAPMIEHKYIKLGLNKLKKAGGKAAITIAEMPYPAQRSLTILDDGNLIRLWPEYATSRSQDLPKSYQDAAHFNWYNLSRWPIDKNMSNLVDVIPIELPRQIVQDIDTEEDWKTAEQMYKMRIESTQNV